MKQPQSDAITINDCRTLFYALTEKIPDTTNQLISNADIVECPIFQNGSSEILRPENHLFSLIYFPVVDFLVPFFFYSFFFFLSSFTCFLNFSLLYKFRLLIVQTSTL